MDAATALEHLTGEPAVKKLGRAHRYNECVFLAPPWPQIYVNDGERRHGLAEAIEEYKRLEKVFPALGYHVSILPKVGAAARADLIVATLASRNQLG